MQTSWLNKYFSKVTQLSNFSDTLVDKKVCVSPSISVSVIYACVGNYSAVDIVSTCKYCSVNSYKVIQSASHVHNQFLATLKWVIPTPEWVFLVTPECEYNCL